VLFRRTDLTFPDHGSESLMESALTGLPESEPAAEHSCESLNTGANSQVRRPLETDLLRDWKSTSAWLKG
jgi:hypothetical protein